MSCGPINKLGSQLSQRDNSVITWAVAHSALVQLHLLDFVLNCLFVGTGDFFALSL